MSAKNITEFTPDMFMPGGILGKILANFPAKPDPAAIFAMLRIRTTSKGNGSRKNSRSKGRNNESNSYKRRNNKKI